MSDCENYVNHRNTFSSIIIRGGILLVFEHLKS